MAKIRDAKVETPAGRTYAVKDVGWCLRHRSPVVSILGLPTDGTYTDYRLRVHFEDGYTFYVVFPSLLVLSAWVGRRRKWASIPPTYVMRFVS